jgi:hypothetical protein
VTSARTPARSASAPSRGRMEDRGAQPLAPAPAGCFDVEAEKAGVRYSFKDLDGMSWSDRPVPKTTPRPRRRR